MWRLARPQRRLRPSNPGRKIAVAVIALLPTSLGAQAQTGLSLQEAVALARENNPEVLQQRNDLGIARSAVRSAYGGLLPTASAATSFGYTAPGELRLQTRTFGEEPESYYSSYSVGLSYQLSGATLLEPRVQRSQQTATERRIAGMDADLDALVTQRYLGVLRAREQIEQARREVARTDEHLRLAQGRLDVGAGTPMEVRSARVQKGRAEIGVVQAANAAATAVLALGRVMGLPLDADVPLTSEFLLYEPDLDLEGLVTTALERNPALLAARAGSSAARSGLIAARTSYLPSLSINVGWRGYVSQYGTVGPLVERTLGGMDVAACERNNRMLELIGEPPQPCPDPGDPAVRQAVREQLEAGNRGFPFDYVDQPWQASVTLSLPLFTGFTRQLQVERARAQAADALHQVRAEELRIRQEVSSAVRNVEAAHRTALLQEEVRENASEELRLARERFRFGVAGSVEVTDAQTNLAQAERERIEAVYDFHQTLAALEALVGIPLRNR